LLLRRKSLRGRLRARFERGAHEPGRVAAAFRVFQETEIEGVLVGEGPTW
jgi:hypothetical protein